MASSTRHGGEGSDDGELVDRRWFGWRRELRWLEPTGGGWRSSWRRVARRGDVCATAAKASWRRWRGWTAAMAARPEVETEQQQDPSSMEEKKKEEKERKKNSVGQQMGGWSFLHEQEGEKEVNKKWDK
ncbi:uncharacterized protein J3R85_018899 [Psidium guajava]|nr:uncharacterized protein J3R85_018899 [Psidium guajava]